MFKNMNKIKSYVYISEHKGDLMIPIFDNYRNMLKEFNIDLSQ
jgi:hypothetical protein